MSDDEDHQPRRRGDVSALWERVEAHGVTIRNLTVEVSDQFRDLRADTASQLSQLSANVTDQIRSSNANIEKIANKLDSNAQAVAESSKPRYTALFGGMIAAVSLSITIVAGLSTLHDRPYDEKLNGLRDSIADLTKQVSGGFSEAGKVFITQREFAQQVENRDKIQAAVTAGRDATRASMEKEITEVTASLRELDHKVVPRDEFVVRWGAEDQRDKTMEASIAGNAQRLHDLELKVYGEHH